MPFIAWNDRLSVRVPSIDREHKELIAILNHLYDAIRANATRDSLSETLARLSEHTRYHFAHEEALFKNTPYPNAEEHCLEHDNMVAWLVEMERKYDEGITAGLSLEMVSYLKDWLFDHILASDHSYASHLQMTGAC